jgi:DNA-binding PadR family transcriptional regulator
LTATEASVLGLLTRGPKSGYELKQAADRSVGYFWTPAKTQIYAVLPRLVQAGLATRREVVQQGRPNKQVYRVTAAGRSALRAWLASSDVGPEPSRNPLLLKLFFGDLADRDALIEHVRRERDSAEKLRRELQEIDARSEPDPFRALTRRYGLAYADAVRSWADEALRELEAME